MTTVQFAIIPIEEDGYHIHIPAMINGQRANFLLDTGASRTVFDEKRIRNFIEGLVTKPDDRRLSTGLGTNAMEISNAVISRFTIGDIVVNEMDAAFLDLSHVNNSYLMLGLDEIDGVIGNDILFHHRAVINFREEALTLHPRGQQELNDSAGDDDAEGCSV